MPEAEIAVSVLVFINISVVIKNIQLRVSILNGTRPNEKQTMKVKGRQCEIRDKSKSSVFDRPRLFISHTIRTKRKRKNMEPIYSDLFEWIDVANLRGAKLSFVRN